MKKFEYEMLFTIYYHYRKELAIVVFFTPEKTFEKRENKLENGNQQEMVGKNYQKQTREPYI